MKGYALFIIGLVLARVLGDVSGAVLECRSRRIGTVDVPLSGL